MCTGFRVVDGSTGGGPAVTGLQVPVDADDDSEVDGLTAVSFLENDYPWRHGSRAPIRECGWARRPLLPESQYFAAPRKVPPHPRLPGGATKPAPSARQTPHAKRQTENSPRIDAGTESTRGDSIYIKLLSLTACGERDLHGHSHRKESAG